MAGTYHGARLYLDGAKKLCQLSHTPAFWVGAAIILGGAEAAQLHTVWTPFCTAVEALVELDDHFNRVDAVDESSSGAGEDLDLI